MATTHPDPADAKPEFFDAFVSYARVDAARMAALRAALEDQGLRLWVDTRDLDGGVRWRPEIAVALDRSSTVVILLSPAWIASPNCRAELREAISRKKRLISVRIEFVPPEMRDRVPAELGEFNDFNAEESPSAGLGKIIRAIRADPAWDELRRWLLTRARLWETGSQDAGQLLRGASLSTAAEARACHEKGQQPGLSDLEQLFVATSIQAATEEAARLEELRRKSFARRAATVRALLPRAPQTALALAAEVWRAADTHDTRGALADCLIAHPRLRAHLARSDGPTGAVQDLAFLDDDALVTVGEGPLNAGQGGGLCVWSAGTGLRRHLDDRVRGLCLAVSSPATVAVGTRDRQLVALRWYDDEERVRFRHRWTMDLPMSLPPERIVYQAEAGLLAVCAGAEVVLVRDGDGALLRFSWKAPAEIAGLVWVNAESFMAAAGSSLFLVPVNGGAARELPQQAAVRALAQMPDGVAAVIGAEVFRFREGTVIWRERLAQRDTFRTLAAAGENALLAGGGGMNLPEPALVLHQPVTGGREPLYADFKHGIHPLAVSPGGRWVAGARRDEMLGLHGGCVPLWDLRAWCPFPAQVLAIEEPVVHACTAPGTDGWATAHAEVLVLRDKNGAARERLRLDCEIKALAAPLRDGRLAAATADGRIYVLDAAVAKITGNSGPLLLPGEEVSALTVLGGGTRLVFATSGGRALLLDAGDLRVLAEAGQHRADTLGHVRNLDAGERVPVRGVAGAEGSPWIRVQPGMSASLVAGMGWWDTRSGVITWTQTGLGIPGNGAPPVSLAHGRMLASDDMAAVVYELPPGADDAEPPAETVSSRHDMIDPPMELLAAASGLLVARCFRELLLFTAEEATPLARLPVPDDARLLALSGDDGLLFVAAGAEILAVSLDCGAWVAAALCKAGRGLTDAERRTYLPEVLAAKAGS